jgi:integrin beta 3
MKRDAQKALLAAAGRYIRRQFGEFEPRLKALESRPAPLKGDPGEPGLAGKDGRDGIDGRSVTLDDVRPIVDEFLKGIPLPKDGEKGLDGVDGKDGADGRSVTIEEVRTYLDAEVATWALGFERRAQGILERAIDRLEKPKDGRDGKDGSDGFSLDDLQIEDDGEGTVTLRFVRGELVRERTFRVPSFSDRGVFREAEAYRKGDGVTFGGSYWFAQKDAPEGKPGMSFDWRLAVKKGRDGRGAP